MHPCCVSRVYLILVDLLLGLEEVHQLLLEEGCFALGVSPAPVILLSCCVPYIHTNTENFIDTG